MTVFFDAGSFQRQPLTPETAARSAVSQGLWGDKEPEIPIGPNRVIVTGTFANSRSILTASGRSVYTEITFQVHDVYQATAGAARSGSEITVLLAGGTVITPSGQLLSYLTQPRELFVQPGRKYLLVLSYRNPGDFYTIDDDWDISDGVVRPASGRSLHLSRTTHPIFERPHCRPTRTRAL